MAHYAWINSENIVINVTVGIDENIIQNGIGGNTEAWEEFYTNSINQEGIYIKRTSYNNNIRKQYAGIGYSYDPINDIFIAPQPFPSWTLNENFDWQSPVPKPEGDHWQWNELELNWVEYNNG